MNNGYYQNVGAMVTQFNRLDVVSNNLANVNTTGFKRDEVVIGDFMRIFKETQDELPLENHTKDGAKYLNRAIDRVPQVSEQYVDFKEGTIKQTSNTLDFALKRGDLFFLVETPNGIRLTQNGSFNLNEQGVLTTKEGYPVLPSNYFQNKLPIKIEEGSVPTVDYSGNIYSDGEELSKFYIAQVDDLKRLKKEGDSFYVVEEPNQYEQIEDGNILAQGYLATSNINPVLEMTALIETNRLVEMYQRVMNTHMNDLNQDSINKLGSVKV